MRRELLINAGPGEWRAALIEDGIVVELHVERGDTRPPGSIHLGRVVRGVAGLGAALVDIGEQRPGFLPVRIAAGQGPRRAPEINEGARVLVQIRREAQGGKGALLSDRIASPDGETDPAELAARAARYDPPAQLAPPPGFAGALRLRLPHEPDRILVDEPGAVPELRAAFASVEVEQRGTEDWPLELDRVFDEALSPTVAVPGGGIVHIEETRTAVLIDIDTGTPQAGSAERTLLAVNLAAAAVIARQMRLRQLGGGIVIDFAALEGRQRRERLRQAIAAALSGDPAQPQLLGWTRLGHLEIVRPRRGRSLSAAMLEPQTARKSAAALGFEALRALHREARARPAANWRLAVTPAVEAALRGPAAAALVALETRLGRRVAIAVAPAGATPPFDIVAL